MTFREFRIWCEHPLWAFFFTVLLSPVFVYLSARWCLPAVGFVFGMIHEALQFFFGVGHQEKTFNWRDVLDFSAGGVMASGLLWMVWAT